MMNPNEWVEFFKRWPRQKVAGFLTLLTFATVTYVALVAATGSYTLQSSEQAAATPTPASVQQLEDYCSIVSPISGETVGSTFTIEANCPLNPGDSLYVLLKDIYPHGTTVNAGPHWLQCKSQVKENGDLLCGAFACIDQAEYELMVVLPKTENSRRAYQSWLDADSEEGREQTPAGSILNENWTIKADHSDGKLPAECIPRTEETETPP